MTNKELYRVLGGIDPDLIEAAAPKESAERKRGGVWLRTGAIAASLLLLVVAFTVAPMLWGEDVPGDDTTERETETDPPVRPVIPSVSVMTSGGSISGKQEAMYGSEETEEIGEASILAPGFYINTVVEARVIEVLPDEFSLPGNSRMRYHVARLSVVDRLRGEGLPDEIFLMFPHYGTDIFDGYDTFLFSLQQVGVENYLLLNETKREYAYFSHMFMTETISDLGYGSVIAFKDGTVDEGFFEKAAHFDVGDYIRNMLKNPAAYHYPVGYGSTLAEAKARIAELSKDTDSYYVSPLPCDYVTADDLFASKEAKTVRPALAPSETNAFMQELFISEDRIVATYTRVVNGFLTDEKIVLNGYTGENGNVLRQGSTYLPEDLLRLPDLGEAVAGLDLSALTPPHVEVKNGMLFHHSIAKGVYRKVGDEIYGVVRILWYYTAREITNGYIKDDCYYLYDESGNGRIATREELKALLGDDPIIARFSYEHPMLFDK